MDSRWNPSKEEMAEWQKWSEEYDPHEDDFIDIFNELFEGALMEAARVYAMHREAKGDSWQEMDIDRIRSLLRGEVLEWRWVRNLGNKTREYNELLDIINVALMLAQRLIEAKRIEEES